MQFINKFKINYRPSQGSLLRGNASDGQVGGQAGQAMVEAMVAMSIIVVGLLGIFTLTSNSIGLSRIAADRYVAVNLASEGIELVKNLIDKNVMAASDPPWNQGMASGVFEIDYNDLALADKIGDGRFLYFNNDGSGYYRYQQLEYPEDKETNFKRIITINVLSSNHIQVVSEVSWTSKKGVYVFSVEDHFYDLKDFKYKISEQLN